MVVGHIQSSALEPTGGSALIAIDMTAAPVPDRRFAADAVWVEVGSDLARGFFAQYRGAGPRVEHLIVLRVPFKGARQFISSMNGELIEKARNYLERFAVPSPPPVDRENFPNQSFTLDANILIAGFAGREACLDLYHTSPYVTMELQKGSKQLRAEPVARVILTTRLLIDMYRELERNKDSMPLDELEGIK